MSGRFCVSLSKVSPGCPVCSAPRRVSTHPGAGTVIVTTCSPYRCRIARTLALAAGPRRVSFEPLPADDRHTSKRLFGGAA